MGAPLSKQAAEAVEKPEVVLTKKNIDKQQVDPYVIAAESVTLIEHHVEDAGNQVAAIADVQVLKEEAFSDELSSVQYILAEGKNKLVATKKDFVEQLEILAAPKAEKPKPVTTEMNDYVAAVENAAAPVEAKVEEPIIPIKPVAEEKISPSEEQAIAGRVKDRFEKFQSGKEKPVKEPDPAFEAIVDDTGKVKDEVLVDLTDAPETPVSAAKEQKIIEATQARGAAFEAKQNARKRSAIKKDGKAFATQEFANRLDEMTAPVAEVAKEEAPVPKAVAPEIPTGSVTLDLDAQAAADAEKDPLNALADAVADKTPQKEVQAENLANVVDDGDVGASPELAQAAQEALAKSLSSENVDKAPQKPEPTIYDTLRKVPFLKNWADKRESKRAEAKVNKLDGTIIDVQGKLKIQQFELTRANTPEEKSKILNKIFNLEKKEKDLGAEKLSYEHRRNKAAEALKVTLETKHDTLNKKVDAISAGIENFQADIRAKQVLKKQYQDTWLAMSDRQKIDGKKSYDQAIRGFDNAIEDVQKAIGRLVVKRNEKAVNIMTFKTGAQAFARMKSDYVSDTPPASQDTPKEESPSAASAGSPLEGSSSAIAESRGVLPTEAAPEARVEKEKPLGASQASLIESWNSIVTSMNKRSAKANKPLLPIVEGSAEYFQKIFDEVKKGEATVTEENMSPSAMKQFIQKYAELTKDKDLTMTTDGQKKFLSAYKKVMGELDMEPDKALLKVDKKKAIDADIRAAAPYN
jgi:hypothetical protein